LTVSLSQFHQQPCSTNTRSVWTTYARSSSVWTTCSCCRTKSRKDNNV